MKYFVPFLLFLAALSGRGQAQQSGDFASQDSTFVKKNLHEKLQSNNQATNPATISNLPNVSLTSLFSDTQAEARFSVNAGESMFNIGLSQSFSEKPKTATFLDIEGITTGTTLQVAWQRTIGKTAIPHQLPISNLQKFMEVKAKVRARKNIDPASEVTFLDMDEADKKELIEAGAINLDAFATPWIFTAKVSASRTSFDYISDSLAAAPASATRLGKNFNVAFSKFKSLYTFFSFSYSYVINYTSGTDVLSYTFPVGTAGHAYTQDVTFGTPTRILDSRVKGEIRQMIRKDRVPFLGINPSITWIVNSNKLNIDLPAYFLTKRENGEFNGLQAGIKLGYTSTVNSFLEDIADLASDKFYFGLFLTKPFSIR